jgi:dihydrofolate reductase
MQYFMIAAMAENRVIGKEGKIPWSIPSDLRHFKILTYHHPVVMGYETYISIKNVLFGRKNIILTTKDKVTVKEEIYKKYNSKLSVKESGLAAQLAKINETHIPIRDELNINGLKSNWNAEIEVCNSKEEVIDSVESHESNYSDKHNAIPFIIGGRSLYKMFMPLANRLFITLIHEKVDGDTRFPTIKKDEFAEVSRENRDGNPKHSYIIFERK